MKPPFKTNNTVAIEPELVQQVKKTGAPFSSFARVSVLDKLRALNAKCACGNKANAQVSICKTCQERLEL
jgi:hypothetical protein